MEPAMEQELLRSSRVNSAAMEQEEAVVLVVGGARMKENKALVADMIAEGRGASQVQTTKDGARIFRRELSPAPVIINTTDLESNYPWEDKSVSNVVRDLAPWISLNFLKQISDKPVFVVCVVECVPSGLWHFPLLEKLQFLFAEHRREIVVLVDSVEWTRAAPDHYRRSKSEFVRNLTEQGFTKNNISFETFTREDLHLTIQSLLESSIVQNVENHGEGEQGKQKMASGKPFRVKKNASTSTGVDFHGHWGPIKVILFGRTGSGKSTLAQMLTRGKLDPECTDFAASSSIRGETTKLNAWEGRGWYVVDTPGFGQPSSRESAVSAEKKVRRYVQRIQGTYCHFLYVAMKGRTDQLEVLLWKFFKSLFPQEISTHFTVVISNADEDWLKQNLPRLQQVYKGCHSFVRGEFPPVITDDEEYEMDLEQMREQSLDHLEEELHTLMRYPVTCKFGQFSKKSQEAEAVSAGLDVPVMRESTLGIKYLRRTTATVVKTQFTKTVGRIARLKMMLMKEENFLLLPEI